MTGDGGPDPTSWRREKNKSPAFSEMPGFFGNGVTAPYFLMETPLGILPTVH